MKKNKKQKISHLRSIQTKNQRQGMTLKHTPPNMGYLGCVSLNTRKVKEKAINAHPEQKKESRVRRMIPLVLKFFVSCCLK